MKKLIVALVVCAISGGLGVAASPAAAQQQRFPDVPVTHEAFEAIEWAAEVRLTLGYDDGTFRPEQALNRRHALVFMERF